MTTNPDISGDAFAFDRQTRRASGAGDVVTDEYVGHEDQLSGFLAGYAMGQSHGEHPNSLLREIDIRTQGPGNEVRRVALKYEPIDPDTPNKPVGTKWKAADANVSQVPIQAHPDYSATWDDPTNAGTPQHDPDKPGVEGYLLAQPEFSAGEVKSGSAFGWTEAEIIGNAGDVAKVATMEAAGVVTPTDAGSGRSKWLQVSRRVKENGETVEEENGWQYAKAGWDTDIYDTET